ncbi:MAG TPA: Type 1 glutamine amidotransferase-like domain-containing protein [Anaeromyxobacteraceae bacterium]|nr:Type 1 glutamine amidotransferase-like domain-containing protein [Anaeromyxobacteraceae bacterium]
MFEQKVLRYCLTGMLFLAAGLPPSRATAKVIRYHSGSAEDVNPTLMGPAYDLGGGGTDVKAALQWMVDRVRGSATVDVVVLRADDSDSYNSALMHMHGVNSVETLVITDRADSNTTEVEATIRKAEVVFFAGGSQCHYVKYFKGTKVESAIKSVIARGGAVGGTSAGCAIMGSLVYDGCGSSHKENMSSRKALSDPFDSGITFTSNFFEWPQLKGVITDTHFVTRDRMGRTLAFLAREIIEGKAEQLLGVAVNEKTSIVVDKDGVGRVMGRGPVYVILADHTPEVCRPRKPLTYKGYKIWKLEPGQTFDFAHRRNTGFYLRSVVHGVVSGDPYESDAAR